MATTKPTKPSITLPSAFGTSSSNVKTAFTAQELIDGYSASIPQVLDGGNVNWLNDTLFKYLTYTTAFCDWLSGVGSNKVPYINSSNQLDSATPVMADANNTFTGNNTFSGSVNLGSSATATTKSAGTSDTSLATTEYVDNADSLAIHKSGTEEIPGQKTLTNDLYIKNTGLATNGTTPGSQTQKQIIFTANDDSVTGVVRSRQTTDGRYALDLICSRLINGTLTNSAISAFVNSDGTTYVTVPTPSGVTLNNVIVPTTEWIRNFVETSGGLSTFTKSSKGGFKFRNGLVVNWGRATSETNTFAIPFYGNTSYSISTATVADEQSATAWGQVNTLTTTGFKVVGASGSRTICWVAIGF